MPFNNSISKYDWQYLITGIFLITVFIFTDLFEVIDKEIYEGVFDKLQMFDKFRDGENLYFDLDICIYDKVPNLIRKDLTVLHAWWRDN